MLRVTRWKVMNLGHKLLTEFAGTFVFLSVIALSGSAGPLAPLAVGFALMVMVYMGGHISGGHYNPAVTFGVFLRQKIDATTMGAYWVTQLIAGVLAFIFGYLVGGRTPGIHPGPGVYTASALAIEVLFTFGLVLTVLNVVATRATEGNSASPLARRSSSAPSSVGRSQVAPSTLLSASPPRSPPLSSTAVRGRTCGCTWSDRWSGLQPPLPSITSRSPVWNEARNPQPSRTGPPLEAAARPERTTSAAGGIRVPWSDCRRPPSSTSGLSDSSTGRRRPTGTSVERTPSAGASFHPSSLARRRPPVAPVPRAPLNRRVPGAPSQRRQRPGGRRWLSRSH